MDSKELKKIYLDLKPPEALKLYGWVKLRDKLPERRSFLYGFIFSRGFAIASVISLVILGSLFGVIRVADASLPGDPLYPVKRFSETVTEKTTGSNQTAIDHRAEEIVTISKRKEQDSTVLNQTVQEYTSEVIKTRTEAKQSVKESSDFQRKLDEHNKSFQEAVKENPSAGEEIKPAIEVSQPSREDIHED